ncbi:MAG TPA: hypothetical protein VFI15_02115 [Candidatus Limnocylindrales bacterium]|nr:hypothetical protein [Candidatus Limnocylindrales bacterium]
MVNLPPDWETIQTSDELEDGSVVVLAARTATLDIGEHKRNEFDQYAIFRADSGDVVQGPIRWDRASAIADYAEATAKVS